MSAVSSEFGATERRSGPEPPEESLSRQAKLYLFTVAAIAVVVGPRPALASEARLAWLADVPRPRLVCRDRTALRGADASRPVVPHDDRLPHPGGHAPPAGARRPDGRRPAHPGMAEGALPLVHPGLQHRQLHAERSGGVGGGADRGELEPEPGRDVRARRPRSFRRLRHAEPRPARDHAPFRARPHAARDRSLLRREPLDRLRPRSARRRLRGHLDVEPMAPSDRRRPAPPDPPLAERSGPPGGGARRSEDRPLQCPLLRRRAARGAGARGPDGPPDVDHHGRPRPPQGHQQLLRPPRRRRRPQGDRRGLPQAAAALRRSRPVRWGGVRHPPARDPAGASARDRRAHPAGGCRPAFRGRDVERADPRHDLPRRRGLPEGRDRPERAHPPGRPRRLPRQAPGPKPCPGRELRAAAPLAHGAPGQARGRTGGRGVRIGRLPRHRPSSARASAASRRSRVRTHRDARTSSHSRRPSPRSSPSSRSPGSGPASPEPSSGRTTTSSA